MGDWARVEREQAAYDRGDVHARSARLHDRFGHVFSCRNTLRGEEFFDRSLASAVPGARVLDYGCFDGWLFPTLASHGPAEVVGIDISERGIAAARTSFGTRANYLVMDAHKLEFPDGRFDVVVGRAILHHLEFERAIREIVRVLRPGGVGLFYEPLRGNPVGTVLRALTPRARTADELPLSREQLRWAERCFGGGTYQFVNLASVPAGMISSLLLRSADNGLMRLADRLDVAAARTPLRFWMRQVVVCWRRTPDGISHADQPVALPSTGRSR